MIPIHAVDIASKENVSFEGLSIRKFKNTPHGVQTWLKELEPSSIVALEPTGRYSELVARLSFEAGHTVYMIQPGWIKAHRRAKGKRAKTDSTDAKAIFSYTLANLEDLHPWVPRPEPLEALRLLVLRREAYARDVARMRMSYAGLNVPSGEVRGVIAPLLLKIKESDLLIAHALKGFAEAKYLLSITGIGPITAAHMLIVLAHLQFETSDAFVAFTGLDPVPDDSGQQHGQRRISKRGSHYLRRSLYTAAMSAANSKAWRKRYESLLARGLKKKQAICALAKKIATTAYHLFRRKELFNPDLVAPKGIALQP